MPTGIVKRGALCLLAAGFAATAFPEPAAALNFGGILITKHNLSISGPGDLKATSEQRVCIFCHVPHHSSMVTPLWSRPVSSVTYNVYQSTTLVAKPGQPSGASRLCLSCHDGTVALGAMYGSPPTVNVIDMAGGVTTIPVTRTTNIGGASGQDLTNDHPVSFAYTADLAQQNGQLNPPAALPPQIRLEQGGLLQCTACHDPHRSPYGKFLVMDNTASALCLCCHAPTGWGSSGHATNTNTKAAGCGNCHQPHNGASPQRLLKNKAEEQNCLPCHQNGGIGADIQSELQKTYTHPVANYTGVHDEAEDPLAAPKHVECEDCHNPHQAKVATASAPSVNGNLTGVKGITVAKTLATPASYEYEVCFRCHADNNFAPPQTIVRRIQELNMRLNFSNLNPSFHPVEVQGVGTNVPSLVKTYSVASMIYCSDCHASNDSVKAGGTGPNGPHGSTYPHILIARYETDIYPLSYQEAYYALCYRCHDPQVLLSSNSAFPKHYAHVVTDRIPCSVCHDSHGVSSLDGANGTANAHLINFDTRFVTSGTGYNSGARTCDVSCHTTTYPPY